MKPFPTKDPSEVIYLGFNFVRLMEAGESIQSATWMIQDSEGADAGGNRSGLPIISGTIVKQKIQAGALGETYRHFCAATMTPSGRVLVLDNFQTIERGGQCE